MLLGGMEVWRRTRRRPGLEGQPAGGEGHAGEHQPGPDAGGGHDDGGQHHHTRRATQLPRNSLAKLGVRVALRENCEVKKCILWLAVSDMTSRFLYGIFCSCRDKCCATVISLVHFDGYYWIDPTTAGIFTF